MVFTIRVRNKGIFVCPKHERGAFFIGGTHHMIHDVCGTSSSNSESTHLKLPEPGPFSKPNYIHHLKQYGSTKYIGTSNPLCILHRTSLRFDSYFEVSFRFLSSVTTT